MRRGELGEFVGNGEPDLQGAVQGTGGAKGDVGDPALDGLFKAEIIFRGSSRFEGQEEVEQGWRKGVGEGKSGGYGAKALVGCRVVRGRHRKFGGEQLGAERGKELEKAPTTDGLKDLGLGEILEGGHKLA